MAGQRKPIIAIVDDDPGLRKALARLLSVLGYGVEAYASGADFLNALARTEAACLVLDISLRDTTGLALARQLAEAGFHVPTIFMTAYEDPWLRQQCMDLGGRAFLEKPFTEGRLQETIETVLRQQEVRLTADRRQIFGRLVEEAMSIVGAHMGNMQLVDKSTGHLCIVAHRGFEPPFLTFFAAVSADEHSACGEALKRGRRIVVSDVETSPIFASGSCKDVLRRAGVRAVQSTPLLDGSGNLSGMISTHWRSVIFPSEETLARLDSWAHSGHCLARASLDL
jgi:FixJ family two-component response regulator